MATVKEAERALILRTLDDCWGEKPEAARRLGISLKTLYNKLHRYELPVDYRQLRDVIERELGGDGRRSA